MSPKSRRIVNYYHISLTKDHIHPYIDVALSTPRTPILKPAKYGIVKVPTDLNLCNVAKLCGTCSKNSLLAVENVNAHKMDFSVAVLSGLGGGHLDDLAGAPLQHHKAVFTEGRALHREGGGRPGVAGLEVGILNIAHCVGGEI